MFKNYLLIFWRNIYRQPVYTLLNLTCLAMGITASLIILLYVNFELNYDSSHAKSDRIYRLNTVAYTTGQGKTTDVDWEGTPGVIGPYIQQDYPEVESVVRLYQFFRDDKVKFDYNGRFFEEENVFAIDSTALTIFSFDFIHGNAATALQDPNKLIISESLAKNIFGNENPVGKIVRTKLAHSIPNMGDQYELMVAGVYKDMPRNSHFIADALISSTTDPYLSDYYFSRFSFSTYLLLKESANPVALAPKLSDIYENYLDAKKEPVLASAMHKLIPLTKVHLLASGGMGYIYIFSAVGFLLLLISMISYVNLVTAQASRRALEIGMRKVMGSNRQQLILQFLAESLFFAFLALGIAVVLVMSFVGPLNSSLGLQLDIQQLWQAQLLMGMGIIILFLGVLGGSYPAFFLSSFQPIKVMKSKQTKGAPLRRMLVAIQFAVVIFVLCCTGMIYEQLQFLRQKDLGFDKEQVVRVDIEGGKDWYQKWTSFKNELEQNPNIASASTSNFIPGAIMWQRPISPDGGTKSKESQLVRWGQISLDFFKTIDVELVAGRSFSTDFPADAREAILVNESFVRHFGLENNGINEKIRWGDKDNPNFQTIVGVVKDFHQNSLRTPIEPQLFILNPTPSVSIKVVNDIKTGINFIEKTWAQIFPNTLFSYRFLDEEIQREYEADQTRGKIFMALSILTILIAFLGLFGLASYLVKRRIKEIGIRKVLGASLLDAVTLITKDFMFLIFLAAIPAFVGAWYFIQKWLEEFAFRADINYLLFALILIAILALTFFTTGLHALRAARLNPAKTLKYE